MSAARRRVQLTLVGLALVLNWKASRDSALAAHLLDRRLTVQIRLRDGSVARSYTISHGRVRSRAGLHPDPELTMTFETPEVALRVMRLRRDHLDFINALRSFQTSVEGPDELVVWFAEMLQLTMRRGHDPGSPVGEGVRRYTSNTNGGPLFVYVKDDRILRVTPIELDETDAAGWTLEARGRQFSPPRKTTLSPHAMVSKSLVYSPDRLLYPLKRVDWDPNGARNPGNRGVSDYERISWEEALDLVASEIRRTKRTHGPGALVSGASSHHSWGNVGHWLSSYLRFVNLIGATRVEAGPESYEGWFWGAVHHWGHSGLMGAPETYGTVEDALRHCELMVFWSSDPEGTGGVYGAQEGTVRRQWLAELGIPFIHIDPYFNHTAALLGGKWIAPRPGSDSALILAIAHVWMTEGLYDEEYVAERTVGFEKWRAYVLGEGDGQPKTPAWQESETGVPARDVHALARQWGSRRTYLAAGGASGFGGACRTFGGADWARGLVCLMAMQGLGKPGVNMGCAQQGAPVDSRFFFPAYEEGGFSGDLSHTALSVSMYQRMPQLPTVNTVAHGLPKVGLPEAIIGDQTTTYVTDPMSIEGQFSASESPVRGFAKPRMYYRYGGSHFGTAVNANRYAQAYRSDSLECVVSQSIWMEGEARFADIILPACTSFERWDIGEFANGGHYLTQCNHRVIVMQHKCIEPLGESRSDFRIFLELATRLGLGSMYSEGLSELDWCKRLFDASDLPKHISWKRFLKKGYYVVPAPPAARREPVAYRWFAEGRRKDTAELTPLPADYGEHYGEGLQTQSGKLEFESSSLRRLVHEEPDRPPIMTHRQSPEGPHAKDLLAKFPLQLITPKSRFSFHTQADGKGGSLHDVHDHRMVVDGHAYWIARINPLDAGARSIADRDLVLLFNDRGSVVCAASLTERIRPGTVHSCSGCSDYRPIGEPGSSPDRAGCVNLLTSDRPMLEHASGTVPNSCLIEVAKWEGDVPA